MVSPGPFGSFVRTVMVWPMDGIDDLGDVPALQGRWETVARALLLLVVVVGASGRGPLIWRVSGRVMGGQIRRCGPAGRRTAAVPPVRRPPSCSRGCR
jgi:hypothetical protein